MGVRVQKSVYVKVRNTLARKMHFCTLVHAVNKDEVAIKIQKILNFPAKLGSPRPSAESSLVHFGPDEGLTQTVLLALILRYSLSDTFPPTPF